MLTLVLGALGVSGVAYVLLRLFWPTFYLDWVYYTRTKRVAEAVAKAVADKKLFIDLFEDKVKESGSRPFIIFHNRTFSYEQMGILGNQAARAALAIGLKPGDNVAVLCHNEPAVVWTYLGRLPWLLSGTC